MEQRLDLFSKYLTVWVGVAMFLGAILGNILPGLSNSLGNWQIASVSIPVAVVLLFMMYPIMLKIEFKEIINVKKNSRPLLVTLVVNWAIKPFTMAFISWLFIKIFFNPVIPDGLANEYIAGMVLLGLAPCTAMVLVWTYLAKGNINYALIQVAINDLVILFLFAPMGKLLIGVSTGFPVPFSTIFWSVFFYVAIPLFLALLTRRMVIKKKSERYLNENVIKRFDPFTKIGLLLTLILVFMFQGKTIMDNPLHIILIAVPLLIQTYLIFFIGYFAVKKLKIDYAEAAPSTFIGASNFFELSIAVALILFGMNSGAALATVVGVLVEVPVMLSLVAIMKNRKDAFTFSRSRGRLNEDSR
ncbi:ACR3 family arsenite efflux transporter [Mesotoga sp. B105.6.4]|uniref:ACR3 family arsenite efflux transporter n=1 Tax=Mesotoga sp. B105.6.4 TaxID=1582224 RepID=UPI000CCC4351|nr:ACR3 family arsenite efflux transporter [Mesotoga sp. B105.6.4]PNS38756.1 arsenic transporter [Mesotoga sp. B105.6.4]